MRRREKVNEVWCQTCQSRVGNWRSQQDPQKARRAARDHARYNNHDVRVDLSVYYEEHPF